MPTVKPVVRNVRLTPELDALIVARAEAETEGNVSQMLRKLIHKGLEASERQPVPSGTPTWGERADAVQRIGATQARAVEALTAQDAREAAPSAERQSATRKPAQEAVAASEPREDAPAGHPVRSEKTTAQILAERRAKRLGR